MNCRFKSNQMMASALLLAAMSLPGVAQVSSKAGHITIVAVMPENLSLSVNSKGAYAASPTNGSEIPATATGVTTAWSLLPGRAKVATLAVMDTGRGFAVPTYSTGTQITGISVTDANRKGASTAIFPDPGDLNQARLPANVPPGTMKIQVQPVL